MEFHVRASLPRARIGPSQPTGQLLWNPGRGRSASSAIGVDPACLPRSSESKPLRNPQFVRQGPLRQAESDAHLPNSPAVVLRGSFRDEVMSRHETVMRPGVPSRRQPSRGLTSEGWHMLNWNTSVTVEKPEPQIEPEYRVRSANARAPRNARYSPQRQPWRRPSVERQ